MNTELHESVIDRIAGIKCLIMDVDGVLTDGRIIIDDQGNETKNFDVRDGHGIKLLMKNGISIILLTGRSSKVVAYRAKDLGITEVYQGATDKVSVLDSIMGKNNLKAEELAYIGDDIVDIPVMRKVGFPVAVADASEYARDAAVYVTKMNGGHGAVREVCELILKGQGKWSAVADKYNMLIL